MADIFISYTKSDRDWAFWIGQQLEKLGHVVHIHEWEVLAGGNLAAWMEERHEKADHILCVISKVYLTRPYSTWERLSAQWAAASERPNFALPVFVEDCKVPTLLAPFKRCDLFGLSEGEARDKLATYMEPSPKPTVAVPFPVAGKHVPAEGTHAAPESVQLGTAPFPGSKKHWRSASTAELHKHKTERAIIWIGTILLSSFVYFHFVFGDIFGPNQLQTAAGPFFISAVAIGIVCSMMDFEKPILATFITTSPAPIICISTYLGISKAWANFPDLTPVANLSFNVIFSFLFGVLAIFGCVIGLNLRTMLENFVSKAEAIAGGDPIIAAKIATVGTLATGLITLFGTIVSAYVKG